MFRSFLWPWCWLLKHLGKLIRSIRFGPKMVQLFPVRSPSNLNVIHSDLWSLFFPVFIFLSNSVCPGFGSLNTPRPHTVGPLQPRFYILSFMVVLLMGLAWMIKIKIVYQFLLSLEVFKVASEVPLGLDDEVHDLCILTFLWWSFLANMFIKFVWSLWV